MAGIIERPTVVILLDARADSNLDVLHLPPSPTCCFLKPPLILRTVSPAANFNETTSLGVKGPTVGRDWDAVAGSANMPVDDPKVRKVLLGHC